MSTANTEHMQQRLADNLAEVRARIAEAAARSGRQADAVRIVAVTKYVSDDALATLLALGALELGENRVQQLAARAEHFGCDLAPLDARPATAARWHMIGHVQRNKVRTLLPAARIIHSVNSVRLINALAKEAAKQECAVEILLELNLAEEESKSGAPASDLHPLVDAAISAAGVRLRGLMTMAPYVAEPEATRPVFASLREKLTALRDAGRVPPNCDQLSMGMSNDYAVAVEEGATIVRLGSVLYAGTGANQRDPR